MPDLRTSRASRVAEETAPIVLLTDPIDADATIPLRKVASVIQLGEPGYVDIADAVQKAHVVIVRRDIPSDALPGAHNLRALIRNGVGLDFIPVKAASDLGIAVVNTPGVNAKSVAEAAIGMMLAGSRRIALKDRMIRQGEWSSLREGAVRENEISGKHLGLIGYGAIAQEIARMAHFGFTMRVAAVSRSPGDRPDHVMQATLDEVLQKSDVIIVACPLTDETRGMIGRDAIAMMKPGAAIINIARGAVIQEDALLEALQSGHLDFAALDVLAEQPPADNPLLCLDNVVLTPHTAGITQQAMRRMSALSIEETLRVLRSERPMNLVNPSHWDRISLRWRNSPIDLPNQASR